jgi:hypothetical protein
VTTFDELIGTEPDGEARARLRNVHELLLEAGPPPELNPEMEAGPTLAMTMSRARAYSRRRRSFILTGIAAALVATVIGLGAVSRGHGHTYPSFSLHGTVFAPYASGTLYILQAKSSTPRMKIEVKGLAPLKKPYVVYLVRNGRPIAQCGTFTVANANREVTALLRSPYPIEGTDKWIVTGPSIGRRVGPTVLRPT